MADTPSNMLPLGTTAPEFYLKDTNSNYSYTYNNLKGSKGTLLVFMCNHCPFVLHVLDEIIMINNDYRVQGISVVAISSNDAKQYPQDAPDKMAEFAYEKRMSFPYLYDQTQ